MIYIIEGDIFESRKNIIGHQTNCLGVMGKGIATTVRSQYPKAYRNYKGLCNEVKTNPSVLLGKCQVVDIGKEYGEEKYIANIFGQLDYGSGLRTNYKKLGTALTDLKRFAKKNELSVALPYRIGCGNAGGDWKEVMLIIKESFADYEVFIYKKD